MITFLDASAVIHASQDSPVGRTLAAQIDSPSSEFVVSPLVRMESLIRPLRLRNQGHLKRRLGILESCQYAQIDEHTFELATHIRVNHGLGTQDAIHLATAGQHGCDRILTSDRAILASAPGFAVDLTKLS